MNNPYIKNWRTTAAGMGTLLVAVGALLSDLASPGWDLRQIGMDLGAVVGGIGLILAQDAVKVEETIATGIKETETAVKNEVEKL